MAHYWFFYSSGDHCGYRGSQCGNAKEERTLRCAINVPQQNQKNPTKKISVSIYQYIFFSWKDKRYELCNQQRVLFFKELFGKTNCL